MSDFQNRIRNFKLIFRQIDLLLLDVLSIELKAKLRLNERFSGSSLHEP